MLSWVMNLGFGGGDGSVELEYGTLYTYTMVDSTTYSMADANTYYLFTGLLPDNWLKGRSFAIKRTGKNRQISRQVRSKSLGNK